MGDRTGGNQPRFVDGGYVIRCVVTELARPFSRASELR